jgi:hypothetical protein
MIYGQIETLDGRVLDSNYGYAPLSVGEVIHFSADNYVPPVMVAKCYEVKPSSYRHATTGETCHMRRWAFELADMPTCKTCGKQAEGKYTLRGYICYNCFI